MTNEGNGYVEKEVDVTLQEGEKKEESQEEEAAPEQEAPVQNDNLQGQPEYDDQQGYGYNPFDDIGQFFFGDGFGRDNGYGGF